ncbi:di-trans,poly-cis-decaprenylcistransferase [Campylobacter sp. FMV-PI01]|uniref:Isoprenyl transferase n=1 Tax=Campylobacter portucalensis TaxID=2608384 RepID=A0A6L5WIT4_9BACT|nr:polyprenyl diphosphate synthase [Campylobacter portucalensis]MSN97059.1 di-trans,poly-cis-decaprenylcistransferase [Campylobacter portucalensis]
MNKLNHLAIIMDGNGRWAKKRGLLRSVGHENGSNAIENIAKSCIRLEIPILSLYAFSTENWARPKKEIDFLINLFKKFLISKEEIFLENFIRFHTIGDLSVFDKELLNLIQNLKDKTAKFDKLTINLAINYGSKDEIARACQNLANNNIKINEKNISKALDTAFLGEFCDVDMLIRTGGKSRLSNFMLWQCAYAELFFTDTLWPDFCERELEKMVLEFKNIKRNFGGL